MKNSELLGTGDEKYKTNQEKKYLGVISPL